jgi:hypothetical protein
MEWLGALGGLVAGLSNVLANALANRYKDEQELKDAVRLEQSKFEAAVSAFEADLKKHDDEADAAIKAWQNGAGSPGASA